MSPRVRITTGIKVGDNLENFVSQMGTPADKAYFTRWVTSTMGREQIVAAYKGDWIARKAVDIPADDATREWRAWQAERADITGIEELENSLHLQRKVMLADRRARAYGGAAIIIGVDVGQTQDELKPELVKKDSLKFLHVVTRHELTAQEFETDITSPYYGQPKFYEVRSNELQAKIHPSRVVRFIGAEPLDPTLDGTGWGDSILQIVADAIKAAGSVSQNVASLLHELQVDIVKVPDLLNQMGVADYENRLKRRFGIAATTKSIHKILLLDKEEEWDRVTAALTGMDELLKTYLMIASASVDVPATRFLSQSPMGMNATGESDVRNYYDMVRAKQTNEYDPSMKILNEVLIRSALGDRPDEIFWEWNPLWQSTEEQQAELANKKANTFKIDVDAGLIEAPIMREARINQLIEDGTYPGLEQTIEEMELTGELEEFRHQEEMAKQEQIAMQQMGIEAKMKGNDPAANENKKPNGKAKVVGDAFRDKRRYKAREHALGRRGKFARTREGGMPSDIASLLASKMGKVTSDSDVSLRPLYVYRPVVNAKAIISHYKRQGLPTMIEASDLHVTVIYSKTAVDWLKAGNANSYVGPENDGTVTIPKGGPRVIEQFGKAIVMAFACEELEWRHEAIKRKTGAEYDWETYIPHVTLTYNAPDFDIQSMAPYTGKIVLGPEVFEEARDGWSETIVEDALQDWAFDDEDDEDSNIIDGGAQGFWLDYSPNQLRHGKGVREGGRFKKQSASASELYTPTTKTADQIVAEEEGLAEAIQRTQERLAQNKHTKDMWTDENGEYLEERKALHDQIVNDIVSPEAVARSMPGEGEAPTLTMLGGRGGSGKSWLSGPEGPVNPDKSILVDSDHIKSLLPEYQGWNAALLHEEASDILDKVNTRVKDLRVNVIHDATLKSEGSTALRMAEFTSAGYQVEGYYMYLRPEEAARRAMKRYAKGGTFQGRFVPPEIILSNTDNEKNFDKFSKRMRNWAVYENEGSRPRLVEKKFYG